jgi:hypothetical protein
MRTCAALIGIFAAILGAACGVQQAPSSPVRSAAPVRSDVSADTPVLGSPASTAELATNLGGRSSGHAEIHGTTVQNVRDESYSFTAISSGDSPVAKGQVDAEWLRFSGETVAVHASVTCLAIVGNTAWIGARVTRFSENQTEDLTAIGRPIVIRVRDLGEGHETADVASLVFFPPPNSNGDLTHCSTRPDFPVLRTSGSGNIQVIPR